MSQIQDISYLFEWMWWNFIEVIQSGTDVLFQSSEEA